MAYQPFESSVNPEGSKTLIDCDHGDRRFESSVNPEGSKTPLQDGGTDYSLRAV